MDIKIFVLYSMIFCHIIADFRLQGILTDLKQKKWWKENYPDKKYSHDYITALIIHSFCWSFMIMLPISIYDMIVFELYFQCIYFILY